MNMEKKTRKLLVEQISGDVRYALRQLRHAPVFTAVVVLTLAVGVVANAAMFGLIDAMIFRPPAHVVEPERLGLVDGTNGRQTTFITGQYAQYQLLNENSRTLEVAAAESNFNFPTEKSYGRGTDAAAVFTSCVSHTYFPLLGTRPFLGRTFTREEDVLDAAPVAVVSHEFWREHLGGDASVLGKNILVVGTNFTVVGVAPKGFKGVGSKKTDIWMLVAQAPEACGASRRPDNQITKPVAILARLRPGVTQMQADAELATLMPAQALLTQMSFNMPDPDFTPIPAKFYPIYRKNLLSEGSDTESKDMKLSVSLAGGSLLLLLISCANVSGLLLSRALERQREITIRMQLGASRARIVSQLFTETVVLMAVSGLVAAAMLVPVIAGVRTLLPFAQDSLFPDMRILGIMLLTLGVATLVTGIFPALQTVRSQSVGAPGQGTHLVSTRSKLRSTLVVAQIALALALAIGTGLFVRSASRIGDVELGYEPNGLSDVTVNLRSIGYAVPEISRVHEAMLESVRRLDFVASAALTYADMVTDRKGGYAEDGHAYFNANDATPIGGMAFPPMVRIVSLGYFSAFKTRILQGRDFTASDMGRSDVVIVDQRLADKLWPKQNPLGQCVRVKPDAPCSIVVGVCEYQNMARIMSIGGFTMYQYFLPWSPVSTLIDGRAAVTSPQPTIMYIRVRDKAGVNDANGALRAAIDKAVPNLPFIKIVPATAKLDEDARLWTLGAEILSWFGGIAIAVAALGVYGVLAFFLRQRTAEIGLRMALGATPGDILFFIFRKGFVLVAVGILLGFMASWWFSRLLQSLLVEFGVESTDPAAFAVAACVVLLVAGLACLIPAWRASRLDPMHALRHAQGGIAARRNA